MRAKSIFLKRLGAMALAAGIVFVFCWLGFRVWVSSISGMVKVLVVEEEVAACPIV